MAKHSFRPPAFLALILALAAPSLGREKLLMDFGWRFRPADKTMPGETGTPITGWKYKAVEGAPSDIPPAPDGTWQDAAPGLDTFHGRVGFTWYSTTLPAGDKPAAGFIATFESVDDNATVYLNGTRLLRHEGWAETFDVALDAAWKKAGPNVLSVLCENTFGIGGMKGVTLRSNTAAVAAPAFDDSAWETVNVPHDYVVRQPVQLNAGDAFNGFHPAFPAWYRRLLPIPESMRGQRIWLEFDGIYRDAQVYLNGKRIAHHPSGYTSFHVDATDSIIFGAANTLAVRVDPTGHEGWWYEGGGIYRHTWLTAVAPVHVAHWGTFVTSEIRAGDATLTVKTTVANESGSDASVTLHTDVLDDRDQVVASADTPAVLLGTAKTSDVAQTVRVAGARLWSPEHPTLYRAVTTVLQSKTEVDRVTTPFGIRSIRFDPDHGFLLNGRPYKIKGTCNHQDFPAVGIALPDRLHEFKIAKLKEMGANACRCSHHQYADELLDACDRLGMLVMDENRHLSDSDRTIDEATSLVLRDRNHPSVILWSICNEEALQGTEQGERQARAIRDVFKRYDPTRPVTAAMQAEWGNGVSHVLDVQGFNYFPEQYDGFHKSHPQTPMIASESASALTTRGEYKQDDYRGYMSSLTTHADESWRPVATREFVAGAFVWTGFDYRGEPSPFGWPVLNSHYGVMDTCGFPKDDYYYYRAAWTDEPTLHLFPHWNHAYPKRLENEDNVKVEVRCYSNSDKVELIVNGKSQGTQSPYPTSTAATQRVAGSPPTLLTWKVRWNPGEITAKGWKDGKEITETIHTASAPAKIVLTTDRPAALANDEDVILVSAQLLDADGHPVPTQDVPLTFAVTSGDATILGTGNGNPSDPTPDTSPARATFHGRALAVLHAGSRPGAVTVTAASPSLPTATVGAKLTAAPLRARLAAAP